MILKYTDIKLADFGSSDFINVPLAGTVSFTSPELLMGYSISYSHDIWAFGCTLLNLGFGLSPFASPKRDLGDDEAITQLRLMEIFAGELMSREFTECTIVDANRDILDAMNPILEPQQPIVLEVPSLTYFH